MQDASKTTSLIKDTAITFISSEEFRLFTCKNKGGGECMRMTGPELYVTEFTTVPADAPSDSLFRKFDPTIVIRYVFVNLYIIKCTLLINFVNNNLVLNALEFRRVYNIQSTFYSILMRQQILKLLQDWKRDDILQSRRINMSRSIF